jgi:hypothetical protein
VAAVADAYVQPLISELSGPPPGGGEVIGSWLTWTPSADWTSAARSARHASWVSDGPPAAGAELAAGEACAAGWPPPQPTASRTAAGSMAAILRIAQS